MPLKVESLSPEDRELDKLVLDELSRMENENEDIEAQRGSEPEMKAEEAKTEEPISEDEEKLISALVNWLKPKKNKDVILERIWGILGYPESILEDKQAGTIPEEKTADILKTPKSTEPGNGQPQEG